MFMSVFVTLDVADENFMVSGKFGFYFVPVTVLM
jgi:hypothetical protein